MREVLNSIGFAVYGIIFLQQGILFDYPGQHLKKHAKT